MLGLEGISRAFFDGQGPIVRLDVKTDGHALEFALGEAHKLQVHGGSFTWDAAGAHADEHETVRVYIREHGGLAQAQVQFPQGLAEGLHSVALDGHRHGDGADLLVGLQELHQLGPPLGGNRAGSFVGGWFEKAA